VNLVVEELAFIITFVHKFQYSLACFGAVFVLALVHLSIRPLLDSVTVLLVVFPVADIFCSIFMRVSSLATRFIIQPLSFVDITVCVVQSALSIGLVILPLANVLRTVSPYLNTETFSFSLHPLSFIRNSIIELDLVQLNFLIFVQRQINQLIVLLCFSPTHQRNVLLFFLRHLQSRRLILCLLLYLRLCCLSLVSVQGFFALKLLWLLRVLFNLIREDGLLLRSFCICFVILCRRISVSGQILFFQLFRYLILFLGHDFCRSSHIFCAGSHTDAHFFNEIKEKF
jgi:hypothetical protein